jgi:hypothetical protein
MLDELLPECGYDTAWVMPDSACNTGIWSMVPKDKKSFNWVYNTTCDSSGWVTVGLIVKNDRCYDTAWYHKELYMLPIRPEFEFNLQTGCAPRMLTVWAIDSIQDSLEKATWTICEYNPNTGGCVSLYTVNQYFATGDSILKQQQFLLPRDGIYQLQLNITNVRQCSMFDAKLVVAGYY